MISLTKENYLKALFHLADEKGEVNSASLSKYLNIKMPTVNSMMKKLAEKKLVHYESYKPLKLTGKGKKEAALIVRKHRLTEMFLVEKMGFGWDQVHDIAEEVEHIQSKEFFDKMDEILDHPRIDPHGSVIPDPDGKITWINYSKLSDCEPGKTVVLSAVIHSSDDFLRFLNSRDLSLGLRVKIISKEDFDGSMVLQYKQKEEALSALVCEKLLVK